MNRTLFTIFLSCCSCFGFAQHAVDMHAGFGFPELFHVGCRVQTSSQSQFGVTYGRFREEDEFDYAVSAEMYFHFGKQGQYASRRLWYYRTGLNFNSESEAVNKDVYWYFNNRIGRDFYFSSRLGINLDLGVAILVSHTVKNERSTGSFLGGGELDLPLLPALTSGFFFRF